MDHMENTVRLIDEIGSTAQNLATVSQLFAVRFVGGVIGVSEVDTAIEALDKLRRAAEGAMKFLENMLLLHQIGGDKWGQDA